MSERPPKMEQPASEQIRLPVSAEMRRVLNVKLTEYVDRLHFTGGFRGNDRDLYKSPEQVDDFKLDIYKEAVLRAVLLEGVVSKESLWKTLSKKDHLPSSKDFDVAWGIIKDYCETGGSNVIGGTGLK